jgi:cell division protein FtsW (lipid II flippase)
MDEQGESAEPQRDRWPPQDSRTWVITFGATLVANITTVLVVGAAVVLLHWERGMQPHHRLDASFWERQALLLGLGVALVAALLILRRRWSRDLDPGTARGLWIAIVLIVATALLVWIGAAAGIK